MKNEIRGAFEQVKADEQLKEKTLEFVTQKTHNYNKRKLNRHKHVITTFACLMLFLTLGSWVYLTPTMAIAVESNHDIELGVNRFDRVVSVKGNSEECIEFAESLDLKHMKCDAAIERIMQCQREEASGNESHFSYNIDCDQIKQKERIQQCIDDCIGEYGQDNNDENCNASNVDSDNGENCNASNVHSDNSGNCNETCGEKENRHHGNCGAA